MQSATPTQPITRAKAPTPHTIRVVPHRFNPRRAGLLLAAMALVLLIADLLALQLHSGIHPVVVGNFRDEFYLDNVHPQEVAPDGTTYRWTRPESTLWLNQVSVGDTTLLALRLGGRPNSAPVTLALQEQPWVTFTADTRPRIVTLLLPPQAPDVLAVGIRSEPLTVAGDTRLLGIKLETFTIRNIHRGIPFPPLGQYLAQLVLVIAGQVITTRLGWRLRSQIVFLVGIACGLAILLASQLLLSMIFTPRLAVVGVALVLLTWLGLPLIERWACDPVTGFVSLRELRILWALTLAAVAIRMIGVLYPSFGGQDLGRNLRRLTATIIGQLYIIAPSGEFAKGLTIYPTGPYLGLMPGLLATEDLASLMQGGLALLDGLTAFLVGLLALKLGGGKYTARFAVALYAANIAAFGAMGYSFSAQIFGQWFTAPLALVLLANPAPPKRRTWLIAMILLSFAVFSHIGVAFLGIGWMGLILLFTTLAYWRIPWWGWGLFLLACLVAFVFLYVEIIGPTLAHAAQTVVPRSTGRGTLFPGYRILLVNGLRLAYSDIGLMLAPLGFLLMAPLVASARTWFQQRVVPLAWLGAAFFFLMVDLLLDVQVRYFYFALPLILSLIALPLGRLAVRNRTGHLIGWALVVAIMLPQIATWLVGTWAEGKIPMTPLTH
jgi:hypothetical protein